MPRTVAELPKALKKAHGLAVMDRDRDESADFMPYVVLASQTGEVICVNTVVASSSSAVKANRLA